MPPCQFSKNKSQHNAIGVEMCVESNGKIHSVTVQNAAELVAGLADVTAFLQTESSGIMM
ncbi:hypothetical protein J41TS2_15020 [Bacillus sonorensis]|nr:hypothetical protein J41TS2_15020 [Bacillus sonorensis]